MNKKTRFSLTAVILAAGLTMLLSAAVAHGVLRKEITVVVAGRARQHVTYSRTVQEVLTEAQVTISRGDEVSPPLSAGLAEGARIVIRRAVPLTITVDGKTVPVTSAAATVRDLLHRRGIVLGEHDKVFPAAHSPLWQGAKVRVLRITHRVVAERTEIPFRVISAKDPATPRGIVRVKQSGRAGIRERLFRLTFADRVVVNRTLVGERIVRTPLDRVISLGSQVLIVSRGQFAGKELILMVATAYSPWCCPGVDGVTANGMRAGYGVVAIDPAIIPLGSRLYIEGYGYAIAGDTGGMIKGLRIDLGFDTRREAIRFGRRPVRVYVIERRARR
ncbi:MAG: ubiquitin-like domain-containing protein [bacterium]